MTNNIIKEDAEYLITNFQNCNTELSELQRRIQNIIKYKPLLPEDPNLELELSRISKKIQNLLKLGFMDGERKATEFVSESDANHNDLLKRKMLTGQLANSEFLLQKINFCMAKVSEFLDELNLINNLDKIKINKSSMLPPTPYEVLEIPIDNFQGDFNVFISHKFIKEDQLLALELRAELKKNNVGGYLAESKKEYELLIGDKIREAIDKSKYVVGIITKYSQTSASVNQELGYALGVKKPIVIMIEKDAQHGVLTYGREPEEFTRENFVNHCKTVIEYILNKSEKSISSKTPQILREKIYPELYDKMVTIYENPDKFKTVPSNPWKELPPSSKLKVEEDLKNLFEQYTKELENWHIALSRANQSILINQVRLGDTIRHAFEYVSLINSNGDIILDRNSTMTPKNWIETFKFIIFDQSISNENNLYDKLLEFAGKTNNGHQRWLQDWKRERPELYTHLFVKLPELRNVVQIEVLNEELQKEQQSMNNLVEQIVKLLQDRI